MAAAARCQRHYDVRGLPTHCDEFEIEVAHIEQARHILLALGFRLITIVDKVRHSWIYQDYEIAIDQIKDPGDFVEIEYIGHDAAADPVTIANGMVAFIKRFPCGKLTHDHSGYPFMLLFPEEVLQEEV